MMKNLRIVLLALLLMAMLVMAWWFVLHPNNEKNQAMQAEIADKQAKLQELNQARGMAGDLQQEITSYESAIAWFQDKLPKEKEMDRVLREIWTMARKNDLAPKSVKPLARPAGGKSSTQATLPEFCEEQPIILELEGDFIGFYKFLQDVENQPRIMRVTQMELARDEKKSPGNVKAKLAMSIYFEKAKAPTPPPSATPAKATSTKAKGA